MKSADCPPALHQRGMSLAEIMVVIGIIGITLAFGVPSIVSTVNDMRMSATANDYLGFLNLARSEAGKRGARVTVCASADGTTCSAANSTDWAVGAVAFLDTDADGVVDTGETVVRILDAAATGLTVTGSTTTGGMNAGRFVYKSSGASDSARAFCVRKTNTLGRDVSVSLQGRASVQTTTVTACP